MNSNKKRGIKNARKALQMATNDVILNPNLSIDNVFPIADKYFENLQKLG